VNVVVWAACVLIDALSRPITTKRGGSPPVLVLVQVPVQVPMLVQVQVQVLLQEHGNRQPQTTTGKWAAQVLTGST
jgi:hypothetical protein